MPSQVRINRLPEAIRDEMARMTLERKTNKAIVEWLSQEHDIKTSISAVNRFTKAILNDYFILVDAGMPIPEIVAKRRHFEFGILSVDGIVFAYLDKMDEEAQLMQSNISRPNSQVGQQQGKVKKADVLPFKCPS